MAAIDQRSLLSFMVGKSPFGAGTTASTADICNPDQQAGGVVEGRDYYFC